MNGYIKLHRKLMEWEWYDDSNTFRLFIHCLLMANHKDNTWRGIVVKKGTFITSYGKLAKELRLSVQNIRTSINKLKSTNELTIKTTNKNTMINVVNWALYQNETITTNDQTNKQDNNQSTINQQATNNKQELKNDKKVKKIIKDTIIPYQEIITYLNQKVGTHYKATSKKTQTLIKARINEGFVLNDFYKVIDNKYNEWYKTDMAQYLRPETLFGTKFEGYLNQPTKNKQENNDIESDWFDEYWENR